MIGQVVEVMNLVAKPVAVHEDLRGRLDPQVEARAVLRKIAEGL